MNSTTMEAHDWARQQIEWLTENMQRLTVTIASMRGDEAYATWLRPSVIYKPRLQQVTRFKPGEGTQKKCWMASYGEGTTVDMDGYGDTPADAMADFDRAWNEWEAGKSRPNRPASDWRPHLPPERV